MKQTLLTLVAFGLVTSGIGSFASARSVDPTPVVATLTGAKDGIKLVALLADGRLQVQKTDGKVTQVKLSALAAGELIEAAKQLANVTITESSGMMVCAGMPPASLARLSIAPYDETKDAFEGIARLILNSQHCSTRNKVAPEHDYNEQAAKELRAQLLILGYSTLK